MSGGVVSHQGRAGFTPRPRRFHSKVERLDTTGPAVALVKEEGVTILASNEELPNHNSLLRHQLSNSPILSLGWLGLLALRFAQ